jgi:hypothetical protein
MDSLSKSGEFFFFFLFSKKYGEFFENFQKKSFVEVTLGYFFGSPVGEILQKKKH